MRILRTHTAIGLGAILTLVSSPIGDDGANAHTLISQQQLASPATISFEYQTPGITKQSTHSDTQLAGALKPEIDIIVSPDLKLIETKPKRQKEKQPRKEASLNIDKLEHRTPRTTISPPKPRTRRISGTAEIRFDDARRIKQWNDVYYDLLAQTNELKHCVNYTSTCNNPALSSWADQIRPFKHLGKNDQVQRINNLVNARGYQKDTARYSQVDYWASPTEFLASRGDCEDYAILKLASLMAVGHANNDLRLVVGDIRGIGSHAFLSVNVQNSEYLLDNRTNVLSKAAERTDFVPKHSMNFAHRWVHLPKKSSSRSI